MTWVKLGDEISGAAEPLSDAAFRLHIEALAWSARHLLDLEIPERHLGRFAYCADPEVAAKELVDAGWWEERGDGWYIGLRWPEWQRPKAEVERERAAALERQHRRRKHLADDHSTCLPQHCPQAPGVESTVSLRDARRESRFPDPTRPVPKGQGRGGERQPSRRDVEPKRPTTASVVSDIDTLSPGAWGGLRERAIASLVADDGLPCGWERDEGKPWEPAIYGRMRKLIYDEQMAEWEADRLGTRRTGT